MIIIPIVAMFMLLALVEKIEISIVILYIIMEVFYWTLSVQYCILMSFIKLLPYPGSNI